MDLFMALFILALVLAILAAIPPLRTYFLLNIAVILIALGLILQSGMVRT